MKRVEETTNIFLKEASLKAVIDKKNHLISDNRVILWFGVSSETNCKGRIFCVVKSKKRSKRGKESTISKTHP